MKALLSLLSLAAPSTGTTARIHRNSHQLHLHYTNHPYHHHHHETSHSRNTLDSEWNQRYPVEQPSSSPVLSPSLESTTLTPTLIGYDPVIYEPLRIHIDTNRLQSTMSPTSDSDTTTKSQFITYLQSAAEKASSFWSQPLSTVPVSSSIEITFQSCPLAFEGINDDDDDDNTSFYTYNDTDIIIYLFVDEGPCLGDEPPIAFSDECAMDQYDRPIAGWLLLCSSNFPSISQSTPEGISQRQKLDEVLQHELAHILGMSGSTMAYWRDSLQGGAPRTPRPLVVGEFQCVNGSFVNMTIPSEDTVRAGVTDSGIRYYEVVTPTVVNVVSNQFDCREVLVGGRLDNFEHFDCIGSHWSTRFFAEETMVSRNMPWEQSISAVTLALFEDTGWYKGNFSGSLGVLHAPSFGYGAGCDFLTNDCIMDDAVPEFGEDIFCKTLTVESPIRCDASHRRFAKCDLVDYSTYTQDPTYPYLNSPPAPDAEFQYFTNTNLGSFMRYDGDYCPTYAAPPYSTYSDGIADGPLYAECASGRDMLADVYDFESFENDSSRCFNTLGRINRPLCLTAECDLSGDDVSIIVTVTDGEKVVCEEDGQVINLASLNIQIECPKREVICPQFFCPAICSGRGLCRHQKVDGCQCFDLNDNSPSCANSPIIQPEKIPSPNPSPASILTDVPTEIPSGFPTKDNTNFPSILAAIVSPTLSNNVHEEVLPGGAESGASSYTKEFGFSSLNASFVMMLLYLVA